MSAKAAEQALWPGGRPGRRSGAFSARRTDRCPPGEQGRTAGQVGAPQSHGGGVAGDGRDRVAGESHAVEWTGVVCAESGGDGAAGPTGIGGDSEDGSRGKTA